MSLSETDEELRKGQGITENTAERYISNSGFLLKISVGTSSSELRFSIT